MCLFHFHSWSPFSLDTELWVDGSFLSVLKNIVLLSWHLHGFWWESCCHSNGFPLVGNVFFLSGCFQDSFFVFGSQEVYVFCRIRDVFHHYLIIFSIPHSLLSWGSNEMNTRSFFVEPQTPEAIYLFFFILFSLLFNFLWKLGNFYWCSINSLILLSSPVCSWAPSMSFSKNNTLIFFSSRISIQLCLMLLHWDFLFFHLFQDAYHYSL